MITGIVKSDFDNLIKDLNNKGFNLNKNNVQSIQFNQLDLEKYWVPTIPIVHIIQNCNSPCIICDCWKSKKKYHDAKVLSSTFSLLVERGAHSVMVSGGEPLLHPQLKEVLSAAKDVGLGIELNTNAILLHKFDWLAKFGLDEIIISMDGIDAESYKFIRGTNKFDKVWENIHIIKKINPEQSIGIRTTLTNVITRNFIEYLDFMDKSIVDYVGFSPLDTDSTSFSRDSISIEVSTDLKNNLLPSSSECKDLISVLSNKKSDIHKKVTDMHSRGKIDWDTDRFIECLKFYSNNSSKRVKSSEPCNFPLISLLIDYDGSLRNCFYSKPFGNIYDKDTINWSMKDPITELKNNNKCSECRGKIFCE